MAPPSPVRGGRKQVENAGGAHGAEMWGTEAIQRKDQQDQKKLSYQDELR